MNTPPQSDLPAGRLRIGAVLLAAGAASRLGGRPKCLLALDGVPLVRRQLAALRDAGADELVLVLGHHADPIEAGVRDLPVRRVHNARPDDGQVSSQRLGLAALGKPLDAVIVALADQPLIDAQDIGALITAFKQRPAAMSVLHPLVDGARGNPVIFTAAVRKQILADAPHVGCRQWQAAHADAVLAWRSDNRHYTLDIDTPDDLARFAHDTGRSLCWPVAPASA